MKDQPFQRFCQRENQKPLKRFESFFSKADHRAKATVCMRSRMSSHKIEAEPECEVRLTA